MSFKNYKATTNRVLKNSELRPLLFACSSI